MCGVLGKKSQIKWLLKMYMFIIIWKCIKKFKSILKYSFDIYFGIVWNKICDIVNENLEITMK